MPHGNRTPTTMSLSSFPDELIEIIAEECAAVQREDDSFYEITRPLLNHGVEALSRTSSAMRRMCLPVLFRTITLRQGDRDLYRIYILLNSEKSRHIAQYIRYVTDIHFLPDAASIDSIHPRKIIDDDIWRREDESGIIVCLQKALVLCQNIVEIPMLASEPSAEFLQIVSDHPTLERCRVRALKESVPKFPAWDPCLLTVTILQHAAITGSSDLFLGGRNCSKSDFVKAFKMGIQIQCLNVDITPGIEQEISGLGLMELDSSQIKSIVLRRGPYLSSQTQDFNLSETLRGVFKHIRKIPDVTFCFDRSFITQHDPSFIPPLAELNKTPELKIEGCIFHTGQHLRQQTLDWDTWTAKSTLMVLKIGCPRNRLLGEESVLDTVPTHCSNAEYVMLTCLPTSAPGFNNSFVTVENIVRMPLNTIGL
jgi:hypothetical protein